MTDSTPNPAIHGEHLQPQRSRLTGSVVSLIGWVVVILPIIVISALIFTAVLNPDAGMATPGKIGLMFLGAVLLFCMIAAPHLLGQAVVYRERAMWRAAAVTGLPTLCVIGYLLFRWLSNLG